jgi:hypothetical protein
MVTKDREQLFYLIEVQLASIDFLLQNQADLQLVFCNFRILQYQYNEISEFIDQLTGIPFNSPRGVEDSLLALMLESLAHWKYIPVYFHDVFVVLRKELQMFSHRCQTVLMQDY